MSDTDLTSSITKYAEEQIRRDAMLLEYRAAIVLILRHLGVDHITIPDSPIAAEPDPGTIDVRLSHVEFPHGVRIQAVPS